MRNSVVHSDTPCLWWFRSGRLPDPSPTVVATRLPFTHSRSVTRWSGEKKEMPAQPRQRSRLLTTGGLKGWQYGVLVVSCVGSMLAGASVVHAYFRPDLVRQENMMKTGCCGIDVYHTSKGNAKRVFFPRVASKQLFLYIHT